MNERVLIEFPSFCPEELRSIEEAKELCAAAVALVVKVATSLNSQFALCRVELCQVLSVGAADVTSYKLVAHFGEPLDRAPRLIGVRSQFVLAFLQELTHQLAVAFPSAAVDLPLPTEAFHLDEAGWRAAKDEALTSTSP